MINLKQLLKENTIPKTKVLEAADHVHNGLQKVFSAGDKEISYHRCERVGLGYIKSISEAMEVSAREARKIAKIYGYRDDSFHQKFIKEDNHFGKIDAQSPEGALAKQTSDEHPHHDETDMSNQEENREVQIARELLKIYHRYSTARGVDDGLPEEIAKEGFTRMQELAQELLTMHGAK